MPEMTTTPPAANAPTSRAEKSTPTAGCLTIVVALVVFAWIFKPWHWIGLGMPNIKVDGLAAQYVEFTDWEIHNTDLEGKMKYKGGPVGEIQYVLYGKDGVKLREGQASHPALKAGETGKVEVSYYPWSQVKKAVIRVGLP